MQKPKPPEQLIEPDPDRKTYIDEQGRKYWFGTGYHGRSIKHYGEPWRFRTTAGDIIGPLILVGLMILGVLDLIFKFF